MRHAATAVAIVLAGWLGQVAPGADQLTSEQPTPHQWVVKSGPQTLLVYTFAPEQYKPYVRELAPLRGANILRDSPADHKHHHGLMYAVRVNGVNFWEETPTAGIEKSVGPATIEVGEDRSGRPRASLRHRIHWLAPADAKAGDTEPAALLVEDRTLRLSVDESTGETALRWRAEFQVGTKAPEVTLTGSNYNGLGLRFPQSLDAVAAHVIGGTSPDLSGTKQSVAPAAWGAVQFKAPATPATVALFSSPRNAAETRFFSMARPFAYLAVTQGLDEKPLRYKAGEKFTLDYLVTAYPDVKPADFLVTRGDRWFGWINRQQP